MKMPPKPVGLYVAAVLGAAYAMFVALAGVSQQEPVVLVHGIIGLSLYASLALFAPVIVRTGNPRLWILIIALSAILLAVASAAVTSLIGYSPAAISLIVSGIRGYQAQRSHDSTST